MHKKTPVSESDFNKVASLQVCNFIKKILQHKRFLVKFPRFLRKPPFTEHLRWLLLYFKRKVMKTFKTSSDFHVKICRRANSHFPSSLVFYKKNVFSCSLLLLFKMKPLRISVFLCKDKIQVSFWGKICWKKHK